MDSKYRRFAPLGLVLALLAAFVSAGLYLIQRSFNLPLQISLALVVIGLAAAILLDPERARKALTGRQARYGSNAAVVLIAFIGIMVVLNYLVFQSDKRWDLTEDKENTLSAETIDVLKNLSEPVNAVAFYTGRYDTSAAKDLLESYKFHSKGDFTYEFKDPEADPIAAQQANVTRDGTIVLFMGANQQQAGTITEEGVTGALLRLMSGGQKVVYFLTGHGEYNPDDAGNQSYSQLKATMQGKNYMVKLLNLLATDGIPADASALVVAGPMQPLLEGEVALIRDYAANGGSLVVLLEPSILSQFGDTPDLLAAYLAETWGIKAEEDVIVDLVGQNLVGQPYMAVGSEYGNHKIVTSLKDQNTVAFFPSARSLFVDTNISGVSSVKVVATSNQSWGETDLASLTTGAVPEYLEGTDHMGPLALLVASENYSSGARLVVVGDSDFPSDGYASAYGNPDLSINLIDWAVKQDDLIDLTPKQTTTRTLTLTATAYTKALIVLVSVILLPGIAIVAGIVMLIMRKNRG